MSTWNAPTLLTVGLALWVAATPQAQQPKSQTAALTPQDRAAIKELSTSYARFLDTCKAVEYGKLFTPDGAFISGPRGTVVGREKLEGLVQSEPYCKDGRNSSGGTHTISDVKIEPSPNGATGKVYLPGREPATSGGHYEDVYVKTGEGWRIKSRTYLSPKEEAAAK